MDIDVIDLIWNASQQSELNHHARQISTNEFEVQSAAKNIRELQRRMFALAGTCQVLCELMVEKLGISQEDLKLAIEQKMADGSVDGGLCPSCGHQLHAGKKACIYCGFRPNNLAG